jgi:hypothetical protein
MYHGVTRDDAAENADKEGKDVAEEDDGKADKKERVLHTRVPAVLEAELKRFAQNLKIPVSNLVRTILEDALSVADGVTENVETRLKNAASQLSHERERLKQKVAPDPLREVFAFQSLTLAQRAGCVKCKKALAPGDHAHMGLTDGPQPAGKDRIFVCDDCLPKG